MFLVPPSSTRDLRGLTDPVRLAALYETQLLDTPPEEAFDRLVRVAASSLNAPVALLSLVDERRQFFKSVVGLGEPWASQRETSLLQSFCQYVVASREPLWVSDSRQDPRVRDSAGVRDLGIAAYLGVPLVTREGHVLGALCAIDTHPREWTNADARILTDLAAAVMTEVELRSARRSQERRQELLSQLAARGQKPYAGLGGNVVVWEATAPPLTFTFVSHQAATLIGYPVERWLGKPDLWISILHPEDRERVIRECESAVAHGRSHQLEYRVLAADGRVVWIRDLVQAIPEGAGPAERLRGVMVDVTAQKELEDYLHFQASLLQAQSEASLDGILVLSPEGRLLSFNQHFIKLWGIPSEVIERHSHNEALQLIREQLVRPEECHARLAELHDCPDQIRRDEVCLKDGRVFEQYTAPVKGEDGVTFGRIWRFRDITVRKRAQQAVEESERRFRALIENSTDLITILAADGTVRYYSPSVRRLLGYEPEELVGRNAFSFIHPEDVAAVLDTFQGLLELPASASVITLPFRFLHKDGSWRFFESTGRNLLYDPLLAGVVVNSRDVTERVASEEARWESEAKYRRIVETTSEGVWLVDPEGRTTFVNERMAELLGYTAAEMLGRPVVDFVPAELQQEASARIERQRQGLRQQVDTRCTRKDGTPIWVSLSANPVRDAEGRITGVLAMVTDITARKQAEEALQASAERLRILSRQLLELQETERRHLARELHDELGQSLTLLKINLAGARDGVAEPALAATLEESVELTGRMLQQVRDLSLDLRPSLLDDLGLEAALTWYLERYTARYGVEVTSRVVLSQERLPASLETAVFRVVQEALTNVARHAHAREVQVAVCCSDGELRVTVEDDGGGFDVEAARRRAMQGDSVGILGMEERVLLSGGAFTIRSTVGEGTQISATFPLASAEPAD